MNPQLRWDLYRTRENEADILDQIKNIAAVG